MTSAVTRAVNAARKSGSLAPADAAAVALTRMYARQIDTNPAELDKLGPQLRQMLESLTMTPKARSSAAPTPARSVTPAPDGAGSQLDELRARRETRAQRATAPEADADV